MAISFIGQINAAHGLGIPNIGAAQPGPILLNDPFIDKDGDGVVTGRFLGGLLETLALITGFSGDADDLDPNVQATRTPALERARAELTREGVIAVTASIHLR